MQNLGHGANVAEMAAYYGKKEEEIIDFSSNINPYVSECLGQHLEELLKKAVSYPDIHYTGLRKEIATYLGCESEEVIPGNGATEIIYLLMKSLEGTLGIFNPTFSEYERSAKLSGLQVEDLYLDQERGFSVNNESLKGKIEHLDAVFICNPNNPTGNVQNLKELLDLLTQENKLLIVDETFLEFIEDEVVYSLVPYVKDYKNLIIIKAITKFYGLPGLRLGYGVSSNVELLEKMYSYKEPWTINTFAEGLTGAMLRDKAYRIRSKAYFKEEQVFMLEALQEIKSVKCYPASANFILLKWIDGDAKTLKERLFLKYNLLIRDASNFKGLDEHFIRVAIKTREENKRLIEALKIECSNRI